MAVLNKHGVPYPQSYALAASAVRRVQRGRMRGAPGLDTAYGSIEDPAELNGQWKQLSTRQARIHEMLTRDGALNGMIALRTAPITDADPVFEIPGADNEPATQAEEEAQALMTRLFIEDPPVPFRQLAQWAMQGLPRGFSYVEGSFGLERDTGYVIPVRWSYRRPYSIGEHFRPWEIDDDGDLLKVRQMVNGQEREMDVRNLLCFVYPSSDGNPEGESILRACNRAEFIKNRNVTAWAVNNDRYAVGSTILKMGNESADDDRFDALMDLGTRLRNAEDGAAVLFPDEEISILERTGNTSHFVDMTRAQNEEMAFCLSVPHILAGGQGGSGQYSSSEVQNGMYGKALSADAAWLCASMQPMINALCMDNFGADIRVPRLRLGNLYERALETAIQQARDAKAAGLIGELSEADVDWVRKTLGMPARIIPEIAEGDEQSGVTASTASENAQQTALNGAQVTSMVEIAAKVAAGEITPAQGAEIITNAFPVSRSAALKIVGAGGTAPSAKVGTAPKNDNPSPPHPPPAPRPKPKRSAPSGSKDGERSADGSDIDENVEMRGCDDADCIHFAALAYGERELKGAERYVDYATLNAEMDDAATRVAERAEMARTDAARHLAEQVRRVVEAGDFEGVDKIRIPNNIRGKLADAVAEELADVVTQGRRSVLREVERQRRHRDSETLSGLPQSVLHMVDPSAPASDPENIDAAVANRGRRAALRSLSPLEEAARDEATRMLESGDAIAGGFATAVGALFRSLVDRSFRALRASVGRHVPAVFNLGRDSAIKDVQNEAQAQDEPVQYVAQYSTVLDTNVCANCLAAETRSAEEGGFLVGSPEEAALRPPLSPNTITGEGCEGGDACRCIYVYQRAEDNVPLPIAI